MSFNDLFIFGGQTQRVYLRSGFILCVFSLYKYVSFHPRLLTGHWLRSTGQKELIKNKRKWMCLQTKTREWMTVSCASQSEGRMTTHPQKQTETWMTEWPNSANSLRIWGWSFYVNRDWSLWEFEWKIWLSGNSLWIFFLQSHRLWANLPVSDAFEDAKLWTKMFNLLYHSWSNIEMLLLIEYEN